MRNHFLNENYFSVEIFFVPLQASNNTGGMGMKTYEELEEILSGRMNADDILSLCSAVATSGSVVALMPFLHSADPIVARNAAWAMTHFTDDELSVLVSRRDEMTDLVLSTGNTGLRRMLLAILYRMPCTAEDVRTDFLDFCLSCMVSLDQPPGVQSLCMKTARRLCSFYPELSEEFMRTVKGMEPCYYTPALKSVRNKILR